MEILNSGAAELLRVFFWLGGIKTSRHAKHAQFFLPILIFDIQKGKSACKFHNFIADVCQLCNFDSKS